MIQEENDEQIVRKVQNGDKDLYGILIERYEAKLTRYGRRFLSNKEDIGDIVQDVFIKAYIHINSFDTSKSFSSWIYRIAHNEYVNHLKKKKSLLFSFFDFDTFFPQKVASEHLEEVLIKEEEKKIMEKAMNELDAKYKEPLVLFVYEEKSYDEISDILQIPKATVGVRIMRAKKLLQDSIRTYERA